MTAVRPAVEPRAMVLLDSIEFWYWWVAAIVFIGIEVFAPGAFFLWMAVSATVVGAVVLVDLRRIDDCFPAIDFFESRGVPFIVAINRFPGNGIDIHSTGRFVPIHADVRLKKLGIFAHLGDVISRVAAGKNFDADNLIIVRERQRHVRRTRKANHVITLR